MNLCSPLLSTNSVMSKRTLVMLSNNFLIDKEEPTEDIAAMVSDDIADVETHLFYETSKLSRGTCPRLDAVCDSENAPFLCRTTFLITVWIYRITVYKDERCLLLVTSRLWVQNFMNCLPTSRITPFKILSVRTVIFCTTPEGSEPRTKPMGNGDTHVFNFFSCASY